MNALDYFEQSVNTVHYGDSIEKLLNQQSSDLKELISKGDSHETRNRFSSSFADVKDVISANSHADVKDVITFCDIKKVFADAKDVIDI